MIINSLALQKCECACNEILKALNLFILLFKESIVQEIFCDFILNKDENKTVFVTFQN